MEGVRKADRRRERMESWSKRKYSRTEKEGKN